MNQLLEIRHRCWSRYLRPVLAVVALLLCARGSAAAAPRPLSIDEVLESVASRYPPVLAALIERDIRDGRLGSAHGAFDLELFARSYGTPAGFYRSGTAETGFEQFTGIWGSTIYGGYRLTWGETLPDYYWNRTQPGGEPSVGLKIPLLRGGRIDKRRAAISRAEVERTQADPMIRRMQLDLGRAASIAYFDWLAASQRARYANQLLEIAREREDALAAQHEKGLIPKITLTDNRRLVVSRQLDVTTRRRGLEAAALVLSLFVRDSDGEPVVVAAERAPLSFPEISAPDFVALDGDVTLAWEQRPEARQIQLEKEKAGIALELAKNDMLPTLDVGIGASQDLGRERYKDLSDFELKTSVEVRLPLQRREAKGRAMVAESRLAQIRAEERFARDRIATEVRDARSALTAGWEQIERARMNVTLAQELESAEEVRFRRGASDFLALQIREQATFDARLAAVGAHLEYFKAQASYDAVRGLAEMPLPDAHSRDGS